MTNNVFPKYDMSFAIVVFDDVTTYMSDAYKTITYDGNDYLGIGFFLGFSEIEETADLTVSSMTISVSGVDQSFISAFLLSVKPIESSNLPLQQSQIIL